MAPENTPPSRAQELREVAQMPPIGVTSAELQAALEEQRRNTLLQLRAEEEEKL